MEDAKVDEIMNGLFRIEHVLASAIDLLDRVCERDDDVKDYELAELCILTIQGHGLAKKMANIFMNKEKTEGAVH